MTAIQFIRRTEPDLEPEVFATVEIANSGRPRPKWSGVDSDLARELVESRGFNLSKRSTWLQLPDRFSGSRMWARIETEQAEPVEKASIIKGSALSGNFGHKGIPGKHGGSKPGGGHRAIGVRVSDDEAAVADKVAEHRFKQERLRQRKKERADSGLKTLKVASTDELPDSAAGAQESHIVNFADGSQAIVKPDQGVEGNSTAHAERLAFEAARELGFGDLVPETVVRDDIAVSGGSDSSVQKWVENAEEYAVRQDRVRTKGPLEPPPPSLTQQTRDMIILDYAIDNGDRHDYNMLIDDNDQLKAIDHGFAYRQKAIIDDRGRERQVQGRSWRESRRRYRELWNESRPDAAFDNQDPFRLTDREKGAMRALAQNKSYMDQVARHLGTEARGRMISRLNFAIENGGLPL